MKVIHGYELVHESYRNAVVTIGNFDGLHLGHRRIVEGVIDHARRAGGTSIVYTFRPHPHLALAPDEELQLLNTYDEKLELLAAMGVDAVIEQPFSREFSEIPPERFFSDVLVKRLSATAIYVGHDFGFGHRRAGSLELLEKQCSEEGVELHVVKPFRVGAEICSSSRIREHLMAGRMRAASRLLGRDFFYRGLVIRGHGRGHQIGFPTANVRTEGKLLVRQGVYATRAALEGRVFDSVTNVGRQPTFNRGEDAPVAVETHLLGFDRDIYGSVLEVRMVDFLRGEVKFDGVDALVGQIRRDVEAAKKILSGSG